MFGVSLQPSASVHPSVARGMGSSHVVMESPAAPRQSERLERLEQRLQHVHVFGIFLVVGHQHSQRVSGFADRKPAVKNPLAVRNSRLEIVLLRKGK